MEALMEQYKVDITFEERENTTIHQLFQQSTNRQRIQRKKTSAFT